eukprot:scaffold116605_cov36-Prasinocladus_malaysianus.AAC.4
MKGNYMQASAPSHMQRTVAQWKTCVNGMAIPRVSARPAPRFGPCQAWSILPCILLVGCCYMANTAFNPHQ